jgi:hypothetical protein
MKKITPVLLIICLVISMLNDGCSKNDDTSAGPYYEISECYFISDTYNLHTGSNFKIINNIDTFNNIFKVNPYYHNPKIIKYEDFNGKIAIGVLYLFNNVCSVHLNLDTIRFSSDTIKLFYNLEVSPDSLVYNSFTCNAIIAKSILVLTNKTDFSSVEFYSNDIKVKAISGK